MRARPYWSARLIATRQSPTATRRPGRASAAAHAAEGSSALAGRSIAAATATPAQITIDFPASVIVDRRRMRTLPSAKRNPAASPSHSPRAVGHGTPRSGFQSIAIAPQKASAITPRPAMSGLSPRRSHASGTVQSGAR
jgi:hypothetical protein